MPDNTNPLDPWNSGDAITAARLQAMQDRIDPVRMIRGGEGVTVAQGPNGVSVMLDARDEALIAFPIVFGAAAGGSSAGGFYAGTIKLPTSTAGATASLSLPQGMADSLPCIIMNAAENGATSGGVPSGTYAIGVLAGFSGSARTPLVMSHVYEPFQILTLSADWTFGENTITGTLAGSSNVISVDLLWPGSFGTSGAMVPYCGLRSNSTVLVMPYPAGTQPNFGLAVGWGQMSPLESCQPDLTQPLTPVCNDDGTVSFTTTNYVRVVLSINPATCP